MNRSNHLRLTILAILALGAIIPLLLASAPIPKASAAFVYPPGNWVIQLKTLGNLTVPTGLVTVYLWNTTTGTPVLINYATNGASGKVVFLGLPGDTWNQSWTGTPIAYAITANYTYSGSVTPILVIPAYTILSLPSAATTPKVVGLAGMLNDTAKVTEDYLWLDTGGGGGTRPGYYTYLYPYAQRVVDEAGFSLTGCGVTLYAQVWTNTGHTSFKQYKLDAKLTNGTFGSEFTGVMPFATVNEKVGWVEFLVPVWMAGTSETGLANTTFIFRWKTSVADQGPIVGRYTINLWYGATKPLSNIPSPPNWLRLYQTWDSIGGSFAAGFNIAAQAIAEARVWVNVRWIYWNLTDVMGNPWWTKEAEKIMKWYENPVDTWMYLGSNVAPGRILMRYPARLELLSANPPYGAGPSLDLYNALKSFNPALTFNLSAQVEWRGSGLWVNVAFYNPNTLDRSNPGRIFPSYGYGLTAGPAGDFASLTYTGSQVEMTDMVKVKGIKLVTKTELPQNLREDVDVMIILPAGLATGQGMKVNVTWLTNNTGFVELPDTTALRWNSDLYGLLAGTTYTTNPVDYSGWLPHNVEGHTNFVAWFQGVKVLDTRVPGGFPAGNLPPVFGSRSGYVIITNKYNVQWNYSLAIYELGFVLEFTPGPKGQTRPVPWFTPFYYTDPSGILRGPGRTATRLGTPPQWGGVWELVKAPIGIYKDFFIVWKGSVIKCSNVQFINLTDNMRNVKLTFPVYDLNLTVWSQDPFKIINVYVALNSTTDFATIGLPYYKVRELTDPTTWWYDAVLPTGWKLWESTGSTGFPFWKYRTELIKTGPGGLVTFEKMPAKVYDIRVCTPFNDSGVTPISAGFRPFDYNVTIYWSKDPYPGISSLNLTTHTAIDLKSYVHDPIMKVQDAGGATLVLKKEEMSAMVLVEPWFKGSFDNFFLRKMGAIFNPYLVRANATDAAGAFRFHSVNATKVSPPTDPDLNRTADDYPGESRYLIGKSTLKSAEPYRFMIYYKGVLVFNESIAFNNPYQSKENPTRTSVYPYVFQVNNSPIEKGDFKVFGIANLKAQVFWAGLNVTWWPTFSLVTSPAAQEFSLLNASKLYKGFNLTVVKRLWGPPVTSPITLVEIPWTPVPPFFGSSQFLMEGTTDTNGQFKVLVPVWNYSKSANLFTYMDADQYLDGPLPGTAYIGQFKEGPQKPWIKDLGPLGINLYTWNRWQLSGDLFGTPLYANFTTIPGTTVGIPSGDTPKLAATIHQINFTSEATTLGLKTPWMLTEIWSLNATGLYNSATHKAALWKSLTTNSAARLKGTGILSGGLFQGRKVGPATVTSYSDFFAYVTMKTIANDLAIEVDDVFLNDLGDQLVQVFREAIKDGSGATLVPRTKLMEKYTPLYRVTGFDRRVLVLRSTPTEILWGFYELDIGTTNLTQKPAKDLVKDWQLRLQFLNMTLEGGAVDWASGWFVMRWPAKLQLTIHAGDKVTFLKNAWVFIFDATNNYNITAALTDEFGYPGSVALPTPVIFPADPLASAEGTKLNLGFNMLRGKYIVRIYFKSDGTKGIAQPFGKVDGTVVWDTFRDEPQHKFIYLLTDVTDPGIPIPVGGGQTSTPVESPYLWAMMVAEATSSGVDKAASQARTYNTKVFSLTINLADQSPSKRAVVGTITITPSLGFAPAAITGSSATLPLVPAGKYKVDATATTAYGTAKLAAPIWFEVTEEPLTVSIALPIYDATVKLVTPSGKPIVGADIKVGPVGVGKTGAEGSVEVTQIPAGSYAVSATWFGKDVSPAAPLSVSVSRTYLMTASKVAILQIQVVGAQNQGLGGSSVTITPTGTTTPVFTGVTNPDGMAAVEVPYGSYEVRVSSRGVEATATVNVTADTLQKITTGVFIEVFGQGLTFAGFALWLIAIIIVLLILIIAAQEYNIYRRKSLPQLFGAPGK